MSKPSVIFLRQVFAVLLDFVLLLGMILLLSCPTTYAEVPSPPTIRIVSNVVAHDVSLLNLIVRNVQLSCFAMKGIDPQSLPVGDLASWDGFLQTMSGQREEIFVKDGYRLDETFNASAGKMDPATCLYKFGPPTRKLTMVQGCSSTVVNFEKKEIRKTVDNKPSCIYNIPVDDVAKRMRQVQPSGEEASFAHVVCKYLLRESADLAQAPGLAGASAKIVQGVSRYCVLPSIPFYAGANWRMVAIAETPTKKGLAQAEQDHKIFSLPSGAAPPAGSAAPGQSYLTAGALEITPKIVELNGPISSALFNIPDDAKNFKVIDNEALLGKPRRSLNGSEYDRIFNPLLQQPQ